MKRLLIIMVLCATTLLVACGSSSNEPDPTAAADRESALEEASATSAPVAEEDVVPRATITPTAVGAGADEAYPSEPAATQAADSYPVPEPLPTFNPYPADFESAWVMIPAGVQCADSLDYNSEAEAAQSLQDAGVKTLDARTIELPVISACDGPTGTQYVVQIAADDVAEASDLGWQEIPVSEIPLFVITSAGVQCEDVQYESEAAAVASLEAAGINTYNSQTIEMMVAASCGSPTSTHYVVEIRANDAETAESLGWSIIASGDIQN